MENYDFNIKNMSDEEKISCAKDFRDISHENLQHASKRGSDLSDEFTRLEVQIATVLFAFAGLFLSYFQDLDTKGFSYVSVMVMKFVFAITIFCLIASLASGLIHIKRKEKFWDNILGERTARFTEWNQVVKKVKSFEYGEAFHNGTSANKGSTVSSPAWTWILQTIFLAVSIILMFALSLVFLFSAI